MPTLSGLNDGSWRFARSLSLGFYVRSAAWDGTPGSVEDFIWARVSGPLPTDYNQSFEFEWGFYALSASKAIFRARTE